MMNTLPDNEMWLYRFLLDELPPDEMESFEIRLLTDDDLQTQVAAAEFDLIDDYQRGALTVAEHTRFEQHFLNSPERRSKLMTAQAFLDTATMPAMTEMPNNVTSIKDFVERKRRNPNVPGGSPSLWPRASCCS